MDAMKKSGSVCFERLPAPHCRGARRSQPFDAKVRYALDKPNLWQRDVKILRNLLKVMPRDLWHRLFKTSGDKAV